MRTRLKTYSGRNTKLSCLLQHLVRCTECGMLMGSMATKKRAAKHGDKVYKYETEVPRRYYKCYGVQHFQTPCREHTIIRAERLEEDRAIRLYVSGEDNRGPASTRGSSSPSGLRACGRS